MRYKFDFLVIGSGIAGLTYALKVAEFGKVAIITKAEPKETTTRYAQGGIAAVMYAPDSIEKHIEDTLRAGCYLNNREVVHFTIAESTDRIIELIQMGVGFDTDLLGKFDLTREGGHTEKRVFHVKDSTGEEIQKKLLQKAEKHPNITVFKNFFALDIITQHHFGVKVTRQTPDITCYGVYAFNQFTNEVDTFISRTTLIATGGCGTIYKVTTNPSIATGDGVAMVYRAKGLIEHMEFIQFHPTALYEEGVKPSFLITEALRGEGAIICSEDGEDVIKKYDERGSLAPRDVVARSMYLEMQKKGKKHLYLDARQIGKEKLQARFPKIYQKCMDIGIDISKDLIPVAPAAHYQVGGIKVDEYGRTTIKNLFASGECTCTGLHGANRLASNSLLEAVVFSHRAFIQTIKQYKFIDLNLDVPDWNTEGIEEYDNKKEIAEFTDRLNSIMTDYVGIVKTKKNLEYALDELNKLYLATEEIYRKSKINTSLCELRNMINVAYLIIKQALQRKESIGLHYIIDE